MRLAISGPFVRSLFILLNKRERKREKNKRDEWTLLNQTPLVVVIVGIRRKKSIRICSLLAGVSEELNEKSLQTASQPVSQSVSELVSQLAGQSVRQTDEWTV